MAFPDGLWLSFIKMVPGAFPNDGVVIIDPLDPSTNDFESEHLRPPDRTSIKGHFTPGTNGKPDRIEFTETFNGQSFDYFADISQFTPNVFVTTNGKRHLSGAPPEASDEDWVGTHTT